MNRKQVLAAAILAICVNVVFVPEGSGQQKRDWIPLITGLAQIIGSTVAILVAVTR